MKLRMNYLVIFSICILFTLMSCQKSDTNTTSSTILETTTQEIEQPFVANPVSLEEYPSNYAHLFENDTKLPTSTTAEQPYASVWDFDSFLSWEPSQDPDFEFNKGRIPLKDRFIGDKVNGYASNEAKVVSLASMSGENGPSQGSKKFDIYSFSYWQYIDVLVMWSGPIGTPSADVIDVAHKNGVKVLGNIFFAPEVYGGDYINVNKFLVQREDGSFPFSDKLIEVANYYGFDGWFINQETEGGTNEDALKMQEFLKYTQEHKPENMEIMWYDAMTSTGGVHWQNALTDQNKMFFQNENNIISNSMFLNFWWRDQSVSRQNALDLGRNPYDIYSGIDVGANGYKTQVNWKGLFTEGFANTSLGIYSPQWTFTSSKSVEEFYRKENQFWVGFSGDPRVSVSSNGWNGLSKYIVAKSTINSLPFTTNFNTGHGHFFSVKGNILNTQDWNNRSLQDIQPTWRWIVDSEARDYPLKPAYDFTQSYYGGSSLNINGKLFADKANTIDLYKTNIEIQKDTQVSISFKTKNINSNLEVGLTFDDDTTSFVKANILKTLDWQTATLDLSPFIGNTVKKLSLKVQSSSDIENYSLNIGEISMYNQENIGKEVNDVTDIQLVKTGFTQGIYADARIKWNASSDSLRYELYSVSKDGEEAFLGSTYNSVYYIQHIERNTDDETTIKIISIDEFGNRSEGASVILTWPKHINPHAGFVANQLFVAPGESITFNNESSLNADSFEWEFEGGYPTSSTEPNPVITYNNPGIYSVRLKAKNHMGSDEVTVNHLVVVSEEANKLNNIAINKPVKASGYNLNSERPIFINDGKTSTKWCALGGEDKWLEIDLGKSHVISQFVLKHAGISEDLYYNSSDFSIQLSQDGKSWVDVLNIVSNTENISSHSIMLTKARYVRLNVTKETQFDEKTVRLYEFEIYGLNEE